MDNSKIAFIFPGQGESHSVGMCRDFYQNYPQVREMFEVASKVCGYDLAKLIFEGPLETLSQTQHCQLAIYVVSVAIFEVLKLEYPDLKPAFCAGLSLGEYSAAAAANVISFEQGAKLIFARGTYMQKACQNHPSTMAVTLGMDESSILDVINQTSFKDELWIANLNCPGQVVVSGTHAAIEEYVDRAKEAGAKRVLPLNVAGAFHSPLMQSAADELTSLLNEMQLEQPTARLFMNCTGQEAKTLPEIKSNLITQITNSVRWQSVIEKMACEGVEQFVEIGCGKVLAGLNKRMGLGKHTISINKTEDLKLLSVEAMN